MILIVTVPGHCLSLTLRNLSLVLFLIRSIWASREFKEEHMMGEKW